MLLSGHHANIEVWRREQALQRTLERRPDLLETAGDSEGQADAEAAAGAGKPGAEINDKIGLK